MCLYLAISFCLSAALSRMTLPTFSISWVQFGTFQIAKLPDQVGGQIFPWNLPLADCGQQRPGEGGTRRQRISTHRVCDCHPVNDRRPIWPARSLRPRNRRGRAAPRLAKPDRRASLAARARDFGALAPSKDSQAVRRSAASAVLSSNVCFNAASAAALPKVSERDWAWARTSALVLALSLASTASQPFGMGAVRWPFKARPRPLRISNRCESSLTRFKVALIAA